MTRRTRNGRPARGGGRGTGDRVGRDTGSRVGRGTDGRAEGDADGAQQDRRSGPGGPASPGASPALLGAADRVRRALLVVTGLLVVADAVWALVGEVRRPLPSFLVAAVATALLLASVWLILERMVRSGPSAMIAWVGGGYLLRVVLLGVALVGGRAAGLDATMIGASLIVGILAGMTCETTILAQARVPTVEPGRR